ncbi:Dabb family protein [Isoptericola sp. b441]|uniref:Dabb family protein n=1 Tax=Actinotalea lenta TaxID=3064654 RepID=A0ABT9DBG2_9CELL|nr:MULTISPECIES: Dabb family protein [unclassified Isoptericola]MDO8106287.1 Dabb family protein [Isoptericola sp. b441]MDO8121993.1 Dabb family protein [Isoptericola sp. b490]
MIRHVVAWTMAGDSPEARRANACRVRDALQALPALVPQVRRLEVGLDLGESATNADVVLSVDVDSRADLEAYRAHPEHRKVADLIGSLAVDRLCVDHEL